MNLISSKRHLACLVLLFTGSMSQDAAQNRAILQPDLTDEQKNLNQQMCFLLADSPSGLPNSQGPVLWEGIGMNNVVSQFLTANPPIDDWTGRIYRDELVAVTPATFSCLEEDDPCVVETSCDRYDKFTGPWLSIALHNLWRVMRAEIKGYDRAIEKFDANNQELVKVLFGQTAFGRDRQVFDVGAFFSGFLLGVQLVLPVFSAGGSFAVALKGLIKKGIKQAIKEIPLNVGDDPSNDGTPFVNSLRSNFKPIQDNLRGVLRGYMDTGVTDIFFQSTIEDTVNFLQNGALLNAITESDEELIEAAAKNIVKQTAAGIVAGIWNEQGVRLGVLNERRCDRSLCAIDADGCGDFRFLASDFNPVVCLEVGIGRDSDFRLRSALAQLELNVEDISKNAATCPRESRVFPPPDTDIISFGFPQCTFPLKVN